MSYDTCRPNASPPSRAPRHRHGELYGGPDPETFVALSRELAELDPVVVAIRA